MFNLFAIIADRVQEQTQEYAQAQAAIGTRRLAGLFDPLQMMGAVTAEPPKPGASTTLVPPKLPPKRRQRRATSNRKTGASKPQPLTSFA
jgi:hypothetical protein